MQPAAASDPQDSLIAACGGRDAMDAILSRLGAVTSIETLSGQSLYEMLQELPERDPQGEVAHQDQINGKTARNKKVEQAERCYHDAQADKFLGGGY